MWKLTLIFPAVFEYCGDPNMETILKKIRNKLGSVASVGIFNQLREYRDKKLAHSDQEGNATSNDLPCVELMVNLCNFSLQLSAAIHDAYISELSLSTNPLSMKAATENTLRALKIIDVLE